MSNGGAKFTLFQFVDDTGTPYASCKLFHYAAGTTTDKTIWTDEAKTTPAAQPIVADSKGIVTFYADGDYYFVLKDSSDNILYDTWDYIRITSDSATMWEGNHGTAYPSAAAANIWQLFAKHTAGNVLQELGINNGSSFVPLVGIDSNLKYAVDTGAADAYLIAPSPPITAYTTGQIFYMKATNANTGASTVNVNSLGIKSIVKNQNTALQANNILANQIVILQYDGTNFELLNPIPETGTQTLTNKTITTPAIITSTLAIGTAPFALTSTTVNPNLNAEQHNGLKVKVLNIGDWDMDATSSVAVAHGLTMVNIRGISVLIIDDASGNIQSLDIADSSYPNVNGNWRLDATNINLYRLALGYYDTVGFDSTSFNRGWITIWYIP